jgi:hypothetical protein
MMSRVAAIIRADFLIRFRRVSTLVVFLLLSALAYVWVPDPKSGRALMQIGGQRVLYNSAAIGMATAMLASMFIGLAGYYVISNAVRRDLDTRCGAIIAATEVRSIEYLLGKFLGNVVFLMTFIGGFMVASMGMQAVRGEAPVEPLVILWQYGLIVTGTITFVAVLALVFECVPWLSGRFGDVFYFFAWAASFGAVAPGMEGGQTAWRYADFTSLGFLITALKAKFRAADVQIGSSTFDPAHGLVVLGPLHVSEILPRITSAFGPILLLPLALLFFHRFDPARTRASSARSKKTWTGRLNAMIKPLSRVLFATAPQGTVVTDAELTFTAIPVTTLALLIVTALTLASHDALPIAVAAAGLFVADMACRDRRAGTTAMIYAAGRLREHFVLWKLASTSIVAFLFMSGALVHAAFTDPARLPGLVAATVFIAASATALGIISSNPKAFIVLFLSLWYVAVNDKGGNPALDFAGFYTTPSLRVVAFYAVLTATFVVAALGMHRARLRWT